MNQRLSVSSERTKQKEPAEAGVELPLALSVRWNRRDLNPLPSACKADALPNELRSQTKLGGARTHDLLANQGWPTRRWRSAAELQASPHPMSHGLSNPSSTASIARSFAVPLLMFSGGSEWSRTIYNATGLPEAGVLRPSISNRARA